MSFGTYWGTDPTNVAEYQKILPRYLPAGGGGGAVNSVTATALSNITVNNADPANPTIGVSVPLNADLDLGAVDILDSTGSAGVLNQVLKSNGAGAGVSWGAGGAGTVTGLGAGLNIGVDITVPAVPVIRVLAPLTSTMDVGNQTISSSTGSMTLTPLAANDCNVLVSGAGKLHVIQSTVGGGANPLFQLENTEASAAAPHLDYYKNSATPANGDLCGALSFHSKNAAGTKREFSRITATAADITDTSENGQISFLTNENATTPTEYFRINGVSASNEIYKTLETKGQYIQNSLAASSLRLRNTALNGDVALSNAVNGAIRLTTTGGTLADVIATAANNITLTSASGAASGIIQLSASANPTFGSGGVVINQQLSPNVVSALRTNIATTIPTQPVVYYPAVHIDNQNSNAIAIEAPKMPYQTMTLINSGIAPNDVWVNFGAAQTFGLSSMYLTSNNADLWVGLLDTSTGNAVLGFLDPITLVPLAAPFLTFTGTSSGTGGTRILCFDEDAAYIYVGGDFTSVNGNAQAQYGITRINKNTYLEDPMFDSTTANYGVNGFVNTICSLGSGTIFAGGKFLSIAPTGSTINNGVRIINTNSTPANQSYDDSAGAIGFDKEVNASVWNGTYAFIGGLFTLVSNAVNVNRNYMIAFDVASNTFGDVNGNSFTNGVWGLALSQVGSFVLTVGEMGAVYIDAGTPNNAATSSNITPSTTINSINRVSTADGKDCFSDNNNHVYITVSGTPPTLTWESLGVSDAGLTQTGLIHNTVTGTGAFVCYSDSVDLKENNPVAQAATFTLPTASFLTNLGNFANATFSTFNLAQTFIADAAVTGWVPTGGSYGCSFT